MSYLFLSYSREDLGTVARRDESFAAKGIDVSLDQDLLSGTGFRAIIKTSLENADCVPGLWSQSWVKSEWVPKDAEEGAERRTLIEAKTEDCTPPLPFPVYHSPDLTDGSTDENKSTVRTLFASVAKSTSAKVPAESEMSLAAPRGDQDVTYAHLALVHVCWRSRKYDKWFPRCDMYRWGIYQYGSKRALDRVTKVRNLLQTTYDYSDEDPLPFSVNHLNRLEHWKSCFLLKQLANGRSLVRAHTKVRGQPELVKLSRYINLFNTDDSITEYFV